jgi:hypothetical protein
MGEGVWKRCQQRHKQQQNKFRTFHGFTSMAGFSFWARAGFLNGERVSVRSPQLSRVKKLCVVRRIIALWLASGHTKWRYSQQDQKNN